MFTFEPQTDEALLNLLKKGDGTYQVIDANYHNKNGNVSLKLLLKIWDQDGRGRVISEYLSKNAAWKIKDFCYSCGLEDAYDNGALPPEVCVGKEGKLKIGVRTQEGFQPDNNVASFTRIKPGESKPISKYVSEEDAPNDDIPF